MMMTDEIKAKAIKFVREAVKGQDWYDDMPQFDMFAGWNGLMSPISRPAFVQKYGEELTAEIEAAARGENQAMDDKAANSHGAAHRKEADANETVNAAALSVGSFIWATGHGLKFDHENLKHHLEEMLEYTRSEDPDTKKLVRPYLCKITRIEDVPAGFFDNEWCLRGWKSKSNGEGEGYEGGSDSDDVQNVDWSTWSQLEQWEKDSFYTLCVLVREPNGRAVVIDPEGYEYPRYVYYRTTWGADFADMTAKIDMEIAERKAKAAAEKAERDRIELEKYNARCAKWAGIMAPIQEGADYDTRNKITKSNILKMAKAAAPGVRFSVRRDDWREFTLSWTNGPTAEELKAATDFALFVSCRDHYDVYADYHDTVDVKLCTFAKNYGEVKNRVRFNRTEAATDRNRPVAVAPVVAESAAVTVTENTAKGGIEIRFASMPSEDVRTDLKAKGWRWSRFAKCWWIKATPEARTYAEGLAAKAA